VTGASVIVRRLGPEAAAKLSAIAGGTRLHVPSRVTPPPTGGRDGFKRLAKLLGHDLAVLVVLHFGDSRIYVPRSTPPKPVDAKAVARLTKRGWSAARIARKLNCSDRTVHAKRAQSSSDALGNLELDEGGNINHGK
jgi:hypothetical protein